MRKKIEWQWEILDKWNSRVKVMGGWLVHTIREHRNRISTSMVFVPDSEHGWMITFPQPEVKETIKEEALDF